MKKYCSKGIYEPIIHLVSWLLLILFPFVLSWSDSASPRPLIGWHVWVQYLFFLVIFYLNYCLFIDRLLFRHKTTWFVVCNVLLLSLLCFVLQYIHDTFRPQTLPFIVEGVSMPPHHPPRMGKILNDLLFMVMFVGLSMALKIFLRTRQVEIRNRELEQQRKDAELKNLKHQLNPHFIFNTLNNIYALIAINGEKAQQVVLELSNLLRYVLYENKETFVPGICGYVKDSVIPGLYTYEAGQACVGDSYAWFVKNSVPREYAQEATEKGKYTIYIDASGCFGGIEITDQAKD